MKAGISSVFRKAVSLFRKVGSLSHKAGSLFGKIVSLFRRTGTPLHGVGSRLPKAGPSLSKTGFVSRKIGPLFPKIGSLFVKAAPLFRKVGSLFNRVVSFFRRAGSLLGKLIRKLWLLPPGRRIDRALQRTWRKTIPVKYRFLPYVTSVLRVLGWAVLVIGVLASIILGLEIMNGGLMVSGTELRGVGMGVSAIVLGIVGSFLAWLFLLVSRELIYLFIHVKENTRNTAESITQESG